MLQEALAMFWDGLDERGHCSNTRDDLFGNTEGSFHMSLVEESSPLA